MKKPTAEILTVQANSCKIIGLEWRKLWFVTVQMGNVSLI